MTQLLKSRLSWPVYCLIAGSLTILLNFFDIMKALAAEDGGRTPIIAMTASGSEEVQDQGEEAGMDDYLAKPALLESLQKTLVRWTKNDRP